ncbi:enoyl-CoA hydratase-related protein [Actinomadura madurae]|uniref:enoyl-CoA hydratase-related protein n=1 Tax=Actinomadura madurae TaxID=1993 RepID=UPI0020D2308A|nr:enoyl-CoA hydratase-related protein [Actinomadura madurae]MCQ0013698.1 enoyl-CoA hydratase-related protein [Actinomadura madurae]
MEPTLVTERRGRVVILRIQREKKRNAIDRETALGIDAALNALEDDPGLRVGVITGTDGIFSAGTDLKDGRDARTERGGEYGVIRRRRSKPLIAAVEGAALGGGFEIVLACDLVVASSTARFGLPEGLRGVMPTSGGLFRAPRALPRMIANQLMLTGENLLPQRAFELGLVNELVEPGQAVGRAVELAERICRSAPTSVAQILARQQDLIADDEARGGEATAAAVEVILGSDDMKEGVAAFVEKRPPAWPGS